jgi:hypothetical protein
LLLPVPIGILTAAANIVPRYISIQVNCHNMLWAITQLLHRSRSAEGTTLGGCVPVAAATPGTGPVIFVSAASAATESALPAAGVV